ncbi:hypothetical protein HPB47_003681 [Ixodes persulcatus]|uniref:Uncharacterized protein n=1 Tax=Ixodes persulcatus TaxID=34615 RepID=A0AC60PHW4_IXOPE|nr:hypothetical protein HPB47_003681 [Ixodes persulcatus]
MITKVAKKRRHGSNSSEATIITQPTHNLVVIIKPTDPATIITNMNLLALKQMLENLAPDGVIQIRPNYRLNLLAIDARNIESTKSLLLGTIQVQTYEPAPPSSNVGVIRGVSTEITHADLWASIREKAPVIQVRRLGKTEAVKLVFSSRTSPEYVFVGHTRYSVLSYLEKPRQCPKCNRFGHLASTCSKMQRCSRCGGEHVVSECEAKQPRCLNCKRGHDAPSRNCPAYKAGKQITNYRSSNNADYTNRVEANGPVCTAAKVSTQEYRSCFEPKYFQEPRSTRKMGKRTPSSEEAKISCNAQPATLILGDFNAHNEAWGDKQTSTRGRSLEDITTAIGLRCLNDGTATFVSPVVQHSVLDLSFATAAVRSLWLAEPDSWGTWRMACILAGHAVPRSPVLGLVIAQNITLPHAAELLADEFTSAPAPPPGFVAATATSTPAQVASNSDFTLTALQYHPTARASINRIYTINVTDVARVRTYSYLRFLLDDRISWKPAVKTTLIRCHHNLNAIRMIMDSRVLYALPLIHVSNAQSAAIETLQRIVVRFCLGLPRYSPNIPTLVEARINLVENHGRELILHHIARQTSCRDFEGIVGTLDTIYPAPPPYASPLNISESIPELRSKRFTAQVAARTLAEYRIEGSHPHACLQSCPEPPLLYCTDFALVVPLLQKPFTDQDHLLWTCPTLADERKSFLDGLRQAGVASATTQDILSPQISDSGVAPGAEEFSELYSGLVSVPELQCQLLDRASKCKTEKRETPVTSALQVVALSPEALLATRCFWLRHLAGALL